LNQSILPILCLYTDSGPDHQCTFGSVQISLVALFLIGDFDILMVVRTVPYHSWTNPAERIMSILNITLQGIAIIHNPLSSESEILFDKADTLEEIRNKAAQNTNLREDLVLYIKNIQKMLHEYTEKLVLNQVSFKTYNPATEEQINLLFEILYIFILCFFYLIY